MVGVARFERATTCTPYRCATRLRHTPVQLILARSGASEQTRSFENHYNDRKRNRRGDTGFVVRSSRSGDARRPAIVAIVGPTAVGKSDLALRLADHLPIEIISADSRQVYRGLDIGTAKPTLDEQRRVTHHVVDVVDPEDDFSLAEFQDLAHAALEGCLRRGNIPMLVGGTGLYVKAIVDGVQLPRVPPDVALRGELEQFARERGADALHRRLIALDPLAASRIDPRNVRRVIRAIEVVEKSGRRFSDFRDAEPRYDVLSIGLSSPREALYRRIDERVERQIDDGIIDETRRVLARGCPPTRPALNGLGYREVVAYLDGRLTLRAAIERIKFETHRFARQQYTWFRLDDPKIHWLSADGSHLKPSLELIRQHIGSTAAKVLEVT